MAGTLVVLVGLGLVLGGPKDLCVQSYGASGGKGYHGEELGDNGLKISGDIEKSGTAPAHPQPGGSAGLVTRPHGGPGACFGA